MLRYESRWRAGGYALIILVIVLSLVPNGPQIDVKQGDKLGHLLAYGSLMFWFAHLANAFGRRIAWALVFVCMGVALEFVQGALAYRSYDPFDMLANTTGVILGWLLALSLRYNFFSRLERLLSRRP